MKIASEYTDEINAHILAYSEDKISGFVREPFREIAKMSGIDEELVVARIRSMLEAGTIRRVRQTLLATSLAQGALVAWKIAPDKLDAAFDFMFQRDPFSGHVVIRSTDQDTSGSEYRLWTTIKVPQGYSLFDHASLLAQRVGAERIKLMPAKGIFALGVGHVRRKILEPGARSETPAQMMSTEIVGLSEIEWRVLLALKREVAGDENRSTPRAKPAPQRASPPTPLFAIADGVN